MAKQTGIKAKKPVLPAKEELLKTLSMENLVGSDT